MYTVSSPIVVDFWLWELFKVFKLAEFNLVEEMQGCCKCLWSEQYFSLVPGLTVQPKFNYLKDPIIIKSIPITIELFEAGKFLTPDLRAEQTRCCAFMLPSNTTTDPQPGMEHLWEPQLKLDFNVKSSGQRYDYYRERNFSLNIGW